MKKKPERGGRVHSHNETRRKDVEKAMSKPKLCPTCGQKVTGTASTAGSGAGGA